MKIIPRTRYAFTPAKRIISPWTVMGTFILACLCAVLPW